MKHRVKKSRSTFHLPVPVACSSFLLLLISGASGLIDTNQNGLSDLWEKIYNQGQLFSGAFDTHADPDGDGWSNSKEATAGTNPFGGNASDGYIRLELTYSPAVAGDLNNDGLDEIITPQAVTVTWPTVVGKKYTLLFSPDLTEESWIAVDEPRIGTGSKIGSGIPLTQPDGSVPEKLFWRVKVEDADSDGDNLTDTEEDQLGTDPNLSDSDNDGQSDFDEVQNGTQPSVPRIQQFKETNTPDGKIKYTWISFAQNGDAFQINDLQFDGTWKTIFTTSYGSSRLPFVPGTISYSLILDPETDYLP